MKNNLERNTTVSYFDVKGNKFRVSPLTLRRLSLDVKEELYKYYKIGNYEEHVLRSLKVIINPSDLHRLLRKIL